MRDLAAFLRLAGESIDNDDKLVRLMFRRGVVLDVTVLRPGEEGK